MRKRLCAVFSIGLLLPLTLPSQAWATHATGASATELNAVESAINSATFLGGSADSSRSNLLGKLDVAVAKVSVEKYADAVAKLVNISDTATALAVAAKPKLADASGITSAVTAATACVSSL